MPAPFSCPRSKLDRAIVAYLKSQGVADYVVPAAWSGQLDMDATPVWVVIRSHNGTPETALSNIWHFQVECAVHAPAQLPVNAPNPGANRVALDQVFASMFDALMQSGNVQDLQATADLITSNGRALATSPDAQQAANNADMVDFTCLAWYPPIALDFGHPRDGGGVDNTTWKEFATFKAIAVPYNVDNLQ
jgi:hypothetical protein